jgi:hypothetical protein
VKADEGRYKALLSTLDLTDTFYFSYTYDLTRTLQSNMGGPGATAAPHFVWNHYLIDQCASLESVCFRLLFIENSLFSTQNCIFRAISSKVR